MHKKGTVRLQLWLKRYYFWAFCFVFEYLSLTLSCSRADYLPAGRRRVGAHIWKRRLLDALVLTSWNSRKVLDQVENKATVNALWVCKYPCACLSMYPMYGERQRRYMICIGVGLQRCSFRFDGQCEKPLERGTSNSTESPRLFCICTVQRVVTEKKQRPHLGETEKP